MAFGGTKRGRDQFLGSAITICVPVSVLLSPCFRPCKGHKPPATAYVAVKSRGYWYYIDDRDQASKATLALVLQLSRLDFGDQKKSAGPILTLPVGR
jgi:hypothetical protein